jgi:hypothetical protein
VQYRTIMPDYFRSIGISLKAGLCRRDGRRRLIQWSHSAQSSLIEANGKDLRTYTLRVHFCNPFKGSANDSNAAGGAFLRQSSSVIPSIYR